MTDIKISELAAATQAHADDLLEASQIDGLGYVTKRLTLDQVTNLVADSAQVAEVIDDAIGALPPASAAWADITGKPATFPPTVPIAWADISGEPATFPPTLPIPWADVSGKPSTFPPDPELVDDRVAALLVAGANVTLTYNDPANTLTIAAAGGGGGGAPSGPAGGDLAGTYPDPTINPAVLTPYALDSDLSNYLPLTGGTLTGALTGTTAALVTASATALAVGPAGAGATFTVNASTASAATGVEILAAVAGGPVTIRSSSTSATANMRLDAKGAGTITLGNSSTGGIALNRALTYGGVAFANTATGAASSQLVGSISPVFTGDPQAPTPAASDNDTSIATTAFVKTALGQTVSTLSGAVATGTTIIPFDNSIPQITEGNEYMTCVITPRSATSKLYISVVWNGAHSASSVFIIAALFQDAIANALATASSGVATVNDGIQNIKFTHIMTSGTTSATTFRVRAGGSIAGTTTFNGFAAGRSFGGVYASSIVIQEVAP